MSDVDDLLVDAFDRIRDVVHGAVEGLGDGATDLTDVQRAFVQAGAVQCGFCTPGLIMAVHALLDHNPRPEELEVREALSGNVCRCTGYGRILDAVQRVVIGRAGS